MTAETLLAEVAALGVRLSASGDKLRIEAQTGAITPALRDRLAAAKPELIARLQAEAPAAEATPEPAPAPHPGLDAILSMPLEAVGRRSLAVRVKLPDGSECWFCSGAAEVVILRGEGVERGAIWTAKELASVIGAGWTRETIGRLIAVKREFPGARIVTDDEPGPVLPGSGGPGGA